MHDSLDWKSDDRAPWVTNSLRARITDLRAAEKRCRNAFTKPYMGEPANYLADAYAEAADLLEAKLPTAHALENGPAGLADATNDPASPDLSSLRKGAEVVGEAAAYDFVAGWHERQAKLFREMAEDDPRTAKPARDRAKEAAIHHAASAAALRNRAADDRHAALVSGTREER